MNPLTLSETEISTLRERVSTLPAITSAAEDPKLFALVAALGIQQEIGTIHDELARFIYHADTGIPAPLSQFGAKLVTQNGHVGVRITATEDFPWEVRLRGFRELIHPDESAQIRQCVIFPLSIARIAAHRGVELVIVREWALNTVFGRFDRSRPYYETNAWELVQNDTLTYSALLARKQVAFLGTHDLTAHVAGISSLATSALQSVGQDIHLRLSRYFQQISQPSVATLILPYIAGVILDDLAQPRNYGSESRSIVLKSVMQALDDHAVDPRFSAMLATFPDAYTEIIRLTREGTVAEAKAQAPRLIKKLVAQIRSHAIRSA